MARFCGETSFKRVPHSPESTTVGKKDIVDDKPSSCARARMSVGCALNLMYIGYIGSALAAGMFP